MAFPNSLFDISLNAIVNHNLTLLSDIRRLPGSLQCNVYRQVKPCAFMSVNVLNLHVALRFNRRVYY